MKEKFVKALSLLLVIITIFSCIPVIGFAEDEIEETEEEIITPEKFNLGLYKTKLESNEEIYYFRIDQGCYSNMDGILEVYKKNSDGSKNKLREYTKYQNWINVFVLEDFVPSEDDIYGVVIVDNYYSSNDEKCERMVELEFKLSDLCETAHIIRYDPSFENYDILEQDFYLDYDMTGYCYVDYYCWNNKIRDSFKFAISVPYNDSLNNYKFYCESDLELVKYRTINRYNGKIIFHVNDASKIVVVNRKTGDEVFTYMIYPSFGPETFEEEVYYQFDEIFIPLYEQLILPIRVWREKSVDFLVLFIIKLIEVRDFLFNL